MFLAVHRQRPLQRQALLQPRVRAVRLLLRRPVLSLPPRVHPLLLHQHRFLYRTPLIVSYQRLCDNLFDMGNERLVSPEEAARKEAWLTDLAKFIVEANVATWAGNGKEVPAQRPGYIELEYPPQENPGEIPQQGFYLRDSFAGYFRAPGMTTVYYNGVPAWAMSYGGHGVIEGQEDKIKDFAFLKAALSQVTPDLPFRGPREFTEGNKRYEFELLEGNIEDGLWREKIIEDGVVTFTQIGIVEIFIHKDANKQPVFPWNR